MGRGSQNSVAGTGAAQTIDVARARRDAADGQVAARYAAEHGRRSRRVADALVEAWGSQLCAASLTLYRVEPRPSKAEIAEAIDLWVAAIHR